MFVNEEGKVKIACQYSWPGELPSFDRALDLEKLSYNGLLAPEDFSELQRGSLDNDANTQSEMFAIGATIISAGILNNFSSVHNYNNKTFSTQGLRDIRRAWVESERYSEIFKSIVLNLVETNPAERLTSSELWEFVSQYESHILEKKQFVIASAPAKVERTFRALR